MKDLLVAIRSRLSDRITCLASKSPTERAVYISTDSVIPEISGFPAIALKDGASAYEIVGGTLAPGAASDEYAGEFDVEMEVEITAFVRLLREEDIIVGNDSDKGVLDVMADVMDELTGWLPGSAYNAPLVPIREEPSQVLSEEGGSFLVQAKTITFRCAKQV